MKSEDDFDIATVFTLEVLNRYPELPIRGVRAATEFPRLWTVGDFVRWMAARAPKEPPPKRIPSHLEYWERFKIEFRIFLCTRSRKYQKLRRQVAFHGLQSQTVAVSIISVAIGDQLGVFAGVITPLVVISSITVLSLGKEAYCRSVDVDRLAPYTGDATPRTPSMSDWNMKDPD